MGGGGGRVKKRGGVQFWGKMPTAECIVLVIFSPGFVYPFFFCFSCFVLCFVCFVVFCCVLLCLFCCGLLCFAVFCFIFSCVAVYFCVFLCYVIHFFVEPLAKSGQKIYPKMPAPVFMFSHMTGLECSDSSIFLYFQRFENNFSVNVRCCSRLDALFPWYFQVDIDGS